MTLTSETAMAMTEAVAPPDIRAREAAVDPSRSFVVQAPAGSGKTRLLVERFLALLAKVSEPEQVLAITFTKKAAAEMQKRVLHSLQLGREASRWSALSDDKQRYADLGAAAHANAEARGWDLEQYPGRLRIQTLDALALELAYGSPLTSRLSPEMQPVEDAGSFYAEAASATLRVLPQQNPVGAALASLLTLRENNVGQLVRDIAGLLAERMFWLHVLDGDPGEWRARLEENLQRAVELDWASLAKLADIPPGLQREILECGWAAAETATNEYIAGMARVHAFPSLRPEDAEAWRSIRALLLRKDGKKFRLRFGAGEGFGSNFDRASQLKDLCGKLDALGIREELCRATVIPAARYSDEQWRAVESVLLVLRHAVGELGAIFRKHGKMDFDYATEAALKALRAGCVHPARHVLVDEFQDTSVSQERLLRECVAAWERDADTCSLFVVGDPMQSIYGFRRAEVRLFNRAYDEWHPHIVMKALQLTSNFRTQETLVQRANEVFRAVFPEGGEVRFAAAEPVRAALESAPLHCVARVEDDAFEAWEAEQICEELARRLAAKPQEQQRTFAVLVRAGRHAAETLALMRRRGIPYRAVELENLKDRQEVLDMLSLAAALTHPGDRIAWLSVLRAPWCGLTRRSLEQIAGFDGVEYAPLDCVLDLLEQRCANLPDEERARGERVLPVLRDAINAAAREPLSRVLARTWRQLGGNETVTAEEQANIEAFFSLVEQREHDGMPVDAASLGKATEKLSAAVDPTAPETVQVMTIHKAKGLEFDTVFVPRCHKTTGSVNKGMLRWVVPGASDDPAGMVMCGACEDEDEDKLHTWVRRQRRSREDAELRRLLYVAITRAQTAVFLYGALKLDKDNGIGKPPDATLMGVSWATLGAEFEASFKLNKAASETEAGAADQQEGLAIAAAATNNLVPFPPAETQMVRAVEAFDTVRRLPLGWTSHDIPALGLGAREATAPRPEASLYRASALTRARGEVAHWLLERLPGAMQTGEPDLSRWLSRVEERAYALLTQKGYTGDPAKRAAHKVASWLRTAAHSPQGKWLFGEHADAAEEIAITLMEDGQPKEVRMDRTFVAGDSLLADGESTRWVIDYKTSSTDGEEDAFLAQEVERYRPKMETYRRALTDLYGAEKPVRLALYFPALNALREITD